MPVFAATNAARDASHCACRFGAPSRRERCRIHTNRNATSPQETSNTVRATLPARQVARRVLKHVRAPECAGVRWN